MKTIIGEEVHHYMESRCQVAGGPVAVVREQEVLHVQGFRQAELVQTLFGWGLRSSSALDGFVWIASVRRHDVNGTYEDALRAATLWVAEDPKYRCVVQR
jgi:hypothetical protein